MFFKSRKMFMVLLAVAIASVALFVGKATFEQWSYFTLAALGFYFTAKYSEIKAETPK